MKKVYRWSAPLLFIALSSCNPSKPKSAGLRILSYSSINAPNGLGELIVDEYKKECLAIQSLKSIASCEIEMISEEGDINLASSYIKNKSYDAVIGLDQWQVLIAQKNRPSNTSFLFAKAPYAILVNKLLWPSDTSLPKKWSDLSKLPSNTLIIQDPRISVVGLGWIRAIKVHHLINTKEARRIVFRSFPSWSLSYKNFLEKKAPLIWTYLSSEAYHRCQEESSDYQALNLEEGYPVQEEWFLASDNAPQEQIRVLQNVLNSKTVQEAIPLKNWMWPSKEGIKMPECFEPLKGVKELLDPNPKENSQKIQNWLDEWSL